MMNRKTKINFDNHNVDLPIITFSLDGKTTYNAIIDTGSELTIIDSSFVREHKESFICDESNQIMSLLGISGDSTHKLFRISSKFMFGESACVVQGYAADINELNNTVKERCNDNVSVKVVFGYDMLKKLSAVIDFKDNSIKLKI